MATYILQFSKCLSRHAPIHRSHYFIYGSWKKIFTKCASWHPPMYTEIQAHLPMTIIQARFYSKRSSKMLSVNTSVDVLSKNLSSNEASDDVTNVIPIGIIMPKNKDGANMKIVIVPLDIRNHGKNYLAKTLVALEELHAHAHEIDEFTNKMIDDCRQKNQINEEQEQQEQQQKQQNQKPRRTASVDDVYFWKNSYSQKNNAVGSTTVSEDKQASKFAEVANLAHVAKTDVEPIAPSRITPPSLPNIPDTYVCRSCPDPQPNEPQLDDPEHTLISANDSDANLNTDLDLVTVDVPSHLNEHLNDLAISSMQLSFKMNMTDVHDAIIQHGEDSLEKLQPTLGEDAMVSFKTVVEQIPQSEPEQTVPLQFSALISGTVQLDVDKLKVEQLTDEHVPNYQDSVTSIAANVCGTALQTNIAELCHARQDENPEMMPWFSYLMTKGYMDVQQQQAAKLNKPCKDKTRQITASVEKGKEQCAKKGANGGNAQKDPPGKNGGGKKDTCGKDGGEKKDPCAKEGGEKKDACGKGDEKKKDPCAQFKKGNNDKKQETCAKDDGEKKDPCDKGGDDKKSDPCAQFKKSNEDAKKKDPCGKDDGDKKDASGKGSGEDDCKKRIRVPNLRKEGVR